MYKNMWLLIHCTTKLLTSSNWLTHSTTSDTKQKGNTWQLKWRRYGMTIQTCLSSLGTGIVSSSGTVWFLSFRSCGEFKYSRMGMSSSTQTTLITTLLPSGMCMASNTGHIGYMCTCEFRYNVKLCGRLTSMDSESGHFFLRSTFLLSQDGLQFGL